MSCEKISPTCSCFCSNYRPDKKDRIFRRIIRNNEKLAHWSLRNNSAQISTILSPNEQKQISPLCYCDSEDPGEVTRKYSKIKWTQGNKKVTHSRYHHNCVPKKSTNSKRTKFKLKSITNCQGTVDNQQNCPTNKFKNKCYCGQSPDQPIIPMKPNEASRNSRSYRDGSLRTAEDLRRTNELLTKPGKSSAPQPDKAEITKDSYAQYEDEDLLIDQSLPKKTSLTSPQEGDFRTLETLQKANDLLANYEPKSQFLNRLRDEAQEVYNYPNTVYKEDQQNANIKYTLNRKLLEEGYEDVNQQNLFKSGEINHNQDGQLYAGDNNMQFDKYRSGNFSALDQNLIDPKQIQTIKSIRNENYFDTHSLQVNQFKTAVPQHRCYHKFALDERNLPIPLNPNNCGISCCCFCNKPMNMQKIDKEIDRTQNETRHDQDQQVIKKNGLENKSVKVQTETNKNLTNIPSKCPANCDCYLKHKHKKPTGKKEFNSNTLSSRKVVFPTENTKMEVQVPYTMLSDPKKLYIDKSCVSTNSWALRFQRGVI